MSYPYLGTYDAGVTFYVQFNTSSNVDGSPITLAGSPVVKVFKDNDTTGSTTGITLGVDSAQTGNHLVTVNTTTGASYMTAGSDFTLRVTTGTVNSISAVGKNIAAFSISDGSAADANLTKIAGVTVSTTTAQLGVNVEKVNNVALTGDGSATPFNVV